MSNNAKNKKPGRASWKRAEQASWKRADNEYREQERARRQANAARRATVQSLVDRGLKVEALAKIAEAKAAAEKTEDL